MAATLGIMTVFAPVATPPALAGSGNGADPLVAFVDFGWLPPSLPNVSYVATADGTGTGVNDVIAQGNRTPDGTPRVDLQLLPGDGPGTANADERMIPATLNDERRAYWVTKSPAGGRFAGDFQLRFPAEDGRWASLSWSVNGSGPNSSKISGVPASTRATASKDGAPPTSVPVSAAWQQTLLHIATQVTNTPAKVPMPLRLTGLPSNFKPDTTLLWRPGRFGDGAPGTWSATLVLHSGDLTATIDVGPHNTLAETASPQAPGTECTTSEGLDACVQYAGSSPAFDKLGGAKGLLKLVTLLGPDEKNWTTNVIVP